MADATQRLTDLGQEIRLKVSVWYNNHNYKTAHSEIKETKKLVNEDSKLKLRFDFNECQELFRLCLCDLLLATS